MWGNNVQVTLRTQVMLRYVMAWGLGGVRRSNNVQVTLRTQVILMQTYPNAPLKIIWVMKLAIIVRESFVLRRKKHGAHCWCTQFVSMEHGKIPKVPSQVLGAPTKMGLLILSCFKEFEFGNGDGTVEIPRTTKSHGSRPKQTLRRLRRLWQQ